MDIHHLNILEKDLLAKVNKLLELTSVDPFMKDHVYNVNILSCTERKRVYLLLQKNQPQLVMKSFCDPKDLSYAKELKAYRNYLLGFSNSIPRLIAYADNLLIFSFAGIPLLNTINKSTADAYYRQLITWVVKKHEFCMKSGNNYQYDIENQYKWLIEDRLLRCVAKYSLRVEIKKFKEAYDLSNSILGGSFVVEHGDLEVQNLMCINNSLSVIDFGASFRSNGMNDFAMAWLTFREYLKEADIEIVLSACEKTYKCGRQQLVKVFNFYLLVQIIKQLDYYITNKVLSGAIKSKIKLFNEIYEKSFCIGC